MISDAIRFIKSVRTNEIQLDVYSNDEIMKYAKSNGYKFTEEELVKAHRSLFLLFNKK